MSAQTWVPLAPGDLSRVLTSELHVTISYESHGSSALDTKRGYINVSATAPISDVLLRPQCNHH